MPRAAALALGILAGSAGSLAAQELGSITGTVQDSNGTALADAEVLLAGRRVVTTREGGFRLDSLPVGMQLVTVRLVGYVPLRSSIEVRAGVRRFSFVLYPMTQVLPTVRVEARRTGIYGTVSDSGFTPLAGVAVQVAGRGGGEVRTDSAGRFGVAAAGGQYAVRITHPGYAEQRLFVELGRREGVELAIRLVPSPHLASEADQVALQELSQRLVMNLRGDRLNAGQLQRYGSLGLCHVMGIAARVKTGGLTIILNGTVVMHGMAVRDLCSWHADEVELVEFGESVCRDVTRSLVDMLHVWCRRFNERPGSGGPPGTGMPGIGTQRPAGPFVVIWERR